MFYIIVKNAAHNDWVKYFKKDPKKNPVKHSFSAFYTDLGKKVKCKLWYSEANLEQAKEVCYKLNTLDPDGSYAVCVMKE